jgi:AcrR family transcriptional regulator
MTSRTLRADAARNRQALLAAARARFAHTGEATGMDEVAAAAGVGVGTLYRHFPTKTDLLHALYAERLAEFAEQAERCVTDPPWARLAAMVSAMIEAQSTDLALADAPTCDAVATSPELAQVRTVFHLALERLIAAAIASGDLRPGVSPGDIVTLCFNRHLVKNPGGWQTYASIVLAGLRAPKDLR